MSVSQNFPTIEPSLNLSFANTKALDSRITFSRPTDAVYYDGKTVTKAEENLFIYSQEFDNSFWRAFGASTVTANATTAPDGTTTADRVAANSANTSNGAFETTVTASVGSTISFFAKADTVNFVAVGTALVSFDAWFNLTTGTVESSFACTASIVDFGNGWYRCILANVTIGASRILITPKPTTGTGDPWSNVPSAIGDSVYLWGAQLEARDTVTAYTPTTTQPITNYIPTLLTAPSNTARFDHNPVTGESLGLLIEEQRTNLLTYSEDYSNASWSKIALNLTSNTIIAPDGALTGSKISSTTGTWSSGLAVGTVSVASSSISIYAKAGEAPILQIATYTYGNFQCYFDLTTGVSNGTVGFTRTMTDVGNGWWRCTVSGTLTVGGAFIFIPMAVNSGLNPAPIGQGIYLWGAQLEAGAFPTSYIKTEASQVTRSADSASMTGANFSDWYRADEGTVYCESSASFVSSGSVAYSPFSLNDGTSANAVAPQYNSNAINTLVRSSAVEVARMIYSPVLANAFYKTAIYLKNNDYATSTNGSVVVVDALGTMPSGINVLDIGKTYLNLQTLNGTIKKISYYPQRLTNENLQALTS